MVLFMRENHPGALLEILEQFASRGVNLCRIESRPTKRTLGDYCFSVDAEGHVDDARLAEAMMGLHRICADVVFLGSYPRADRTAAHGDRWAPPTPTTPPPPPGCSASRADPSPPLSPRPAQPVHQRSSRSVVALRIRHQVRPAGRARRW